MSCLDVPSREAVLDAVGWRCVTVPDVVRALGIPWDGCYDRGPVVAVRGVLDSLAAEGLVMGGQAFQDTGMVLAYSSARATFPMFVTGGRGE